MPECDKNFQVLFERSVTWTLSRKSMMKNNSKNSQKATLTSAKNKTKRFALSPIWKSIPASSNFLTWRSADGRAQTTLPSRPEGEEKPNTSSRLNPDLSLGKAAGRTKTQDLKTLLITWVLVVVVTVVASRGLLAVFAQTPTPAVWKTIVLDTVMIPILALVYLQVIGAPLNPTRIKSLTSVQASSAEKSNLGKEGAAQIPTQSSPQSARTVTVPRYRRRLGLIACCFVPVYLLTQIVVTNYQATFPTTAENPLALALKLYPLISLALIVVIAPIYEELLLRGVLFCALMRHMPVGVALLIQAAVFALIHGSHQNWSYTFGLGVFLGLILLKTGSLIICCLTHMAYNLCSVLESGMIKQTFTFSLGAIPMGIVAAIYYLACIALGLWLTKRILDSRSQVEGLL